MLTKSEARKFIQQRKKDTSEEFRKMAAIHCTNRLQKIPEWKQADLIFTYISYNRELSTYPLIEQAWLEGKQTAVPRVEGQEMNFYLFDSWKQLKKSEKNILEPQGTTPIIRQDALFLMPGVAFDEQRNRIGYGGGFYDRYLEKYPQDIKIALAYEFQILSDLETKEFDIRPDKIITESRIIW